MSRVVAAPNPFSANTLRAEARSLALFWALSSSRRPAWSAAANSGVTQVFYPARSLGSRKIARVTDASPSLKPGQAATDIPSRGDWAKFPKLGLLVSTRADRASGPCARRSRGRYDRGRSARRPPGGGPARRRAGGHRKGGVRPVPDGPVEPRAQRVGSRARAI